MKVLWKNEIENIKQLLLEGKTTQEIGKLYGVSKQRIYQVMTKFNLVTNARTRKNFLRDKDRKYYWFNKMLCQKGIPRKDRTELLESFEVPDICPILGLVLNYDGTGEEGWKRDECSPSIDQIEAGKGYTKDNMLIISWRANRIKNDGTPEEHLAIYQYYNKLTK